jgi:dTDP-4-dehydrorhamnose 3,5-epimerase-like enzyme
MQEQYSNIPCLVEFPSIGASHEGYISVAEVQQNIPFLIKRVYWTYFTPQNVIRGYHAHKELQQFIFAVSGKIIFKTEDRFGTKKDFLLDQPHIGLYLPPLTWREIQFSHTAVLLCLASEWFSETDYFRHYSDFKNFVDDEK